MAALSDQRLIVVSGKGGVGKSTVAAALALCFSKRGLRTLICEVNTKERASVLLGHPEVGPEIKWLEENLWAVNVRPPEAMREYALMKLKLESIYNAVFENRLVRYFLRFVPSLAELVMLGKILFHLRERNADRPRFDRIVVDAPATGHAITFFSVPQVLLDTVPPGPLARDAEWMRDLLVDPAMTAALLVCLPEEMPVNETIELAHSFERKVGLHVAAVVLNSTVAPRFQEGELARLAAWPSLEQLAKAHAQRAAVAEELGKKLATQLARPLVSVPRLYLPFSRHALEEVARHLSPLWEGS